MPLALVVWLHYYFVFEAYKDLIIGLAVGGLEFIRKEVIINFSK